MNKILPKVIIHNSISFDGSFVNFMPNMELHYKIAATYRPDARLIGSSTVKIGVNLYSTGIPNEEKNDFIKPNRDADLPYWVIVDSKGSCKGLLHIIRRFEFCKDVIVLVSENTPNDYIEYLTKRNYDHLVIGEKHVNLKNALNLLLKKYHIQTILADTGKILGNILLNEGLAKEISILIHPMIVGKTARNLFSHINKSRALKMEKCKVLDSNYVWLVYTVDS